MTIKTHIPETELVELKTLLAALKDGPLSPDQQTRMQALMQRVDAGTLGELEQEIIREGVSREEIRTNLCDIHLKAMRDQLEQQKVEVEAPHPVHTLMEEHKLIVGYLEQLAGLLDKLEASGSYSDFSPFAEELGEIAHHLIETEKHHKREEEGLFPILERHGIQEPPAIMVMDHEEFWPIKERIQELANVARAAAPHTTPASAASADAEPSAAASHAEADRPTHSDRPDFDTFKRELLEIGPKLVEGLKDHIFKEDTIIYQMALNAVTEREWKEIKQRCDLIGYCCFTPEDR